MTPYFTKRPPFSLIEWPHISGVCHSKTPIFFQISKFLLTLKHNVLIWAACKAQARFFHHWIERQIITTVAFSNRLMNIKHLVTVLNKFFNNTKRLRTLNQDILNTVEHVELPQNVTMLGMPGCSLSHRESLCNEVSWSKMGFQIASNDHNHDNYELMMTIMHDYDYPTLHTTSLEACLIKWQVSCRLVTRNQIIAMGVKQWVARGPYNMRASISAYCT